jgi:hypothetical protein
MQQYDRRSLADAADMGFSGFHRLSFLVACRLRQAGARHRLTALSRALSDPIAELGAPIAVAR